MNNLITFKKISGFSFIHLYVHDYISNYYIRSEIGGGLIKNPDGSVATQSYFNVESFVMMRITDSPDTVEGEEIYNKELNSFLKVLNDYATGMLWSDWRCLDFETDDVSNFTDILEIKKLLKLNDKSRNDVL